MTRSDNLVPIAMLWGTEELKAAVGECERLEWRKARAGDLIAADDDAVEQFYNEKSLLKYPIIIRKPTWTWCETPTDEMARLRPRCEVRDCHTLGWIGGTLLSVEDLRKPHNCRWSYCARVVHTGDRFWQYCRVRLSANGEVMVDWEGEE